MASAKSEIDVLRDTKTLQTTGAHSISARAIRCMLGVSHTDMKAPVIISNKLRSSRRQTNKMRE